MKTVRMFLGALLGIALSAGAFGQAGASGVAGDLTVVDAEPHFLAGVTTMPGTAKTEKAAFLGVVATPVPAALREQVDLKRGVGLVVAKVESGSPAEQAGIKRFDVLVKLDDQWLINPQQFGTLVRMQSPGQEISVTLVRKGKEQSVKAKLIEKEVPVFAWQDDNDAANAFSVAPWPGAVVKFSGVPNVDLDRALDAGDTSMTSIGITDSEHTATLTIQDGHKNLTIKKNDGTVVFDGPVDTPEQREQLRPDLLKKLEKLEARPTMIRMRLRSQPGGPTTARSSEE